MENENESIETAKPRPLMGLLKCLGWGILILVVLSAIGLIWQRGRMRSKLRETLAVLDQTEPGWHLEDIEAAREDVPEEENSAHVVAAAARWMPGAWPPPGFPDEPFQPVPPNQKLNDEDFLRLSRELASKRPALDLAIKLADMPRGRHRINYERNPSGILLTDQQESRRIATLLAFESMRLNQKGDTKGALTACRAALNAARSLGDEPIFISQLIRSAGVVLACQTVERTLGQGEPSPEDMNALQKLLESEDACPDLLLAARGERALFHKAFEAVERGDLSVDEMMDARTNWLQSIIMSLSLMDTRGEHALFLSLMSRRIKEVQLPMQEQAALEKRFEQDVRELPKNAPITRALLLPVSKMGEGFRQKHAFLRSTIAALAVERHRRDKKAWPESLDQICPQYLAAVPLDPYDGKPLRYRRVQDGVVIYSVSRDRVDDGGKLDRGQYSSSGLDIGIRLWDAAQRRQPPQARRLPPNPR
jgi:hypothetical protein